MTMDKAVNALELLGFDVRYEVVECGWVCVKAYRDGSTHVFWFDDDEILVSEEDC